MSSVQLRDTRSGLILAYTALNLPLTVWMLWGFIKEVPAELEEAAMVDGAELLAGGAAASAAGLGRYVDSLYGI